MWPYRRTFPPVSPRSERRGLHSYLRLPRDHFLQRNSSLHSSGQYSPAHARNRLLLSFRSERRAWRRVSFVACAGHCPLGQAHPLPAQWAKMSLTNSPPAQSLQNRERIFFCFSAEELHGLQVQKIPAGLQTTQSLRKSLRRRLSTQQMLLRILDTSRPSSPGLISKPRGPHWFLHHQRCWYSAVFVSCILRCW